MLDCSSMSSCRVAKGRKDLIVGDLTLVARAALHRRLQLVLQSSVRRQIGPWRYERTFSSPRPSRGLVELGPRAFRVQGEGCRAILHGEGCSERRVPVRIGGDETCTLQETLDGCSHRPCLSARLSALRCSAAVAPPHIIYDAPSSRAALRLDQDTRLFEVRSSNHQTKASLRRAVVEKGAGRSYERRWNALAVRLLSSTGQHLAHPCPSASSGIPTPFYESLYT